MAPIFSQRFIAQQGVTGVSSSVTVPAGAVYIVKQITAYGNPLLAASSANFRNATSGETRWSFGGAAGGKWWGGFYGALVFEAGETFDFTVTAGIGDAVDVYAGGYVLTAP